MRRREFIALIAGTPLTWPLGARAQQPAMPVVGFLHNESPDANAGWLRAFHQGLSQPGFVEGRNVTIEYRWAESQYDRLPALAADLVRRQVRVIVAGATQSAVAAKAATTTIPIVFRTGSDPVALGLVASLNRPGGNVTGVSLLNLELMPKRLELLRELVPTASVALLVNPNPGGAVPESQSNVAQAAARTLGLELHVLHASTERDIDIAFARLVQLRVGALVIGISPYFQARSEQLAALAIRHAVPTISAYREAAEAGGLMSYGTDLRNQFRIVGAYAGRILKGAKPADLPVQQASKVELIINLKTAKALGLTVPLSLRGRANEVIE
jgi:putative tryptophan/tyrosine transport system substrate-binding protein